MVDADDDDALDRPVTQREFQKLILRFDRMEEEMKKEREADRKEREADRKEREADRKEREDEKRKKEEDRAQMQKEWDDGHFLEWFMQYTWIHKGGPPIASSSRLKVE